jgi:hypothetical protein
VPGTKVTVPNCPLTVKVAVGMEPRADGAGAGIGDGVIPPIEDELWESEMLADVVAA